MARKTRNRKLRRSKANVTLKKLESKVSRMMSTLKPELKVSDSSVQTKALKSPMSENPGDFLIMNLPDPTLSTGTGYYSNRIGEMIRIRSIQVKAVCRFTSSAVIGATVRFMLVRFPTSQIPLTPVGYVLANDSTTLAVNSPYSSTTRNEFQVLWDKSITLNNFGNDSKHIKMFKKVNLPVYYVGNTTAVSSGGLVLLAFSDTDTSDGPVLDLYARVRYTDV